MNKELIINELLNPFNDEMQKLIIYGAGEIGEFTAHRLKKQDISIFAFCDKSEQKIGTKILDIPCISIDELINTENTAVLIAIGNEEIVEEIRIELKSLGVNKIFANIFKLLINYFPEVPTYQPFVPIGHYYSLHPSIDTINNHRTKINNSQILNSCKDIDFNLEEQRSMIDKIYTFKEDMFLWKNKDNPKNMRYYIDNTYFVIKDATVLHGMIRIFKPKKLIEVGSGFSSAMTLDTNEHFFNNSINLTFIEPYPDRLNNLLKETDNVNLIVDNLQNIPVSVFEELNENDILFIDSTHVSKLESDVNYLFFEIFPRLKPGVVIHLHDIFENFEYPMAWIDEGRIWNEIYLLRAFLQNNSSFKMLFFTHMWDEFETNNKGGSFWLQKIN